MKLFIGVFFVLSLIPFFIISAQDAASCPPPYYIPTACPSPYIPGQKGGYTADLNCKLENFFTGTSLDTTNTARCCPNRCVDASGDKVTVSGFWPTSNPSEFRSFEVFGTTIRINPDNIPSLINILFTTALGLVSLYTIARGIYVAGVKRSSAQSAEDIANVTKELTNLLVGALIAWGFIIVIQVVAGFLGVGQLNNLDISGGDNLVVTIN